MLFSGILTTAVLTALTTAVSALPKVSRIGRYLYQEDGTRFFIKGVAYQQLGTVTTTDDFPEPDNFNDPLAIPSFCTRDVPLLQELGINAIRVYSVDPTLNHDQCMAMLSNAGIYTIVDLSQPLNGSMDRATPKWTSNLLSLYLTTINAFSKYDNVLAYTVGNEVIRSPPETVAAPFIKAAARDVKAYLKSKGYAGLVTYASTDGSQWRNNLAQYLACGDESTSLDLYGLNNYEWVGEGSSNSYRATNQVFSTYNIPAYFSEYGSNARYPTPRPFTEVAAIFSPDMSEWLSGGLAFSYFPASKPGFALVSLNPDGTVSTNEDFDNLKAQYNAVTSFVQTPSAADAGDTQYPACAPPDGVNFLASNSLPPTPDQGACNCMVSKASSCVYTPRTVNISAVLGPLFSYTCSELGKRGINACDDLSANGQTGEYGKLAACDPQSQLSYVFTAFFEANNFDAASCDFDGNATFNSNAPTNPAAIDAAVSSCMLSAEGVETPTGPGAPVPTGGSGKGGNGGGGSGDGDGAATRLGLPAASLTVVFVLLSALTLL